MGSLHAIVASALQQAEPAIGTSFAVDGVSGTFVGIHNRFAYQETLAVGGYQESVDAVIVASKDQFTDRWLPNRNGRCFVAGKAYTIKSVSEDEVQFTFGLIGINQ